MAVLVYKDGVQYRVEPHDLYNHLQAGYTLENVPAKKETKTDDVPEMDLEQARLAYADKFGEKPHHKMKFDTILEKLNGDQSV